MQLTTQQTNSKISTALELARLRDDSSVPHYKDAEQIHRYQWLGQEIVKLNQILHKEVVGDFLNTDVVILDETIMDDAKASDLTFEEISEAFRRGVCGVYGPYYGLTPLSMMDFLRAFLESPKKKAADQLRREWLKEKQKRAEIEAIRKEVEARNNGN